MLKWFKSSVNKLFSTSGSDNSLVHIKDDGFMSDDINVSIEDIINGEDSEDIGKLHILSLTEFHQALGKLWDEREDKIFLLTESVLRDNIGAGNRWEHRSKEIYIMLFPTLSEFEADARSYEIGEELGMKIIGERFDGKRRPQIRVAGVDPKDAMSEDGTLDIELLEKAGRAGKGAGKADAGDGAPDTDAAKPVSADDENAPAVPADERAIWYKEKNGDADEDDRAWKENQHASEDANTDWQKGKGNSANPCEAKWQKNANGRGPADDPNWKENQRENPKAVDDPKWETYSCKPAAQDTANTKPKPKTKKSPYGLTFAPCWSRAKESLSLYKAILTYTHKDAKVLEGVKAYSGYKTDAQRFKINGWMMQNTAKALFPLLSKKVDAPIFVPVFSSSLREPYLGPFLDQLGNFTHNLRKNHLIIEIIDDGVWDATELQGHINRFKELIRGVAFQPSPSHDFAIPDVTGLQWIGLDLSALDENTGVSPERLIALQGEVKKLSAELYIFGLNRRVQLAEMLELGGDILSGPALVRTTKKLRPPFALPKERLEKSAKETA